MTAFYAASVAVFLQQSPDEITGALTLGASAAGFHQQLHAQTQAWRNQIALLKEALAPHPTMHEWHLVLECPIPRRGKRVDAVLLAHGLIVVMEFKLGATSFASQDVAQVEDYALDLRDFHEQSAGRRIGPVLVASRAPLVPAPLAADTDDWVKRVRRANGKGLGALLLAEATAPGHDGAGPIDPQAWLRSRYQPTPTIAERKVAFQSSWPAMRALLDTNFLKGNHLAPSRPCGGCVAITSLC